jgi:hypothetical protein
MESRLEFESELTDTEFSFVNICFVNADASTAIYRSLNVSVIQGGLSGLWDVLFSDSAASANIGGVTGAEVAQLSLVVSTALAGN